MHLFNNVVATLALLPAALLRVNAMPTLQDAGPPSIPPPLPPSNKPNTISILRYEYRDVHHDTSNLSAWVVHNTHFSSPFPSDPSPDMCNADHITGGVLMTGENTATGPGNRDYPTQVRFEMTDGAGYRQCVYLSHQGGVPGSATCKGLGLVDCEMVGEAHVGVHTTCAPTGQRMVGHLEGDPWGTERDVWELARCRYAD